MTRALILACVGALAAVSVALRIYARRRAPTPAQRQLARHVEGPTAKVIEFPDPKRRIVFRSRRRAP